MVRLEPRVKIWDIKWYPAMVWGHTPTQKNTIQVLGVLSSLPQQDPTCHSTIRNNLNASWILVLQTTMGYVATFGCVHIMAVTIITVRNLGHCSYEHSSEWRLLEPIMFGIGPTKDNVRRIIVSQTCTHKFLLQAWYLLVQTIIVQMTRFYFPSVLLPSCGWKYAGCRIRSIQ